MNKKELIKYLKSLGLVVHTTTKARGHHGFFLKNRIDVSKNLPEDKQVQTLLHEFAHFIHSKIETNMDKTGGTISSLFLTSSDNVMEELLRVTYFVDKNSLCEKLKYHKNTVKDKIKVQENIIKKDYPQFMRTKKFKEFEKYIKKSDAKYLLKYDRIKLIKGFFRLNCKIYSIENIEKDFPDMPGAFCAYIRLHSLQKKQARISARINKIKNYYSKPSELFARFVEGLYMDKDYIKEIAPITTEKFYKLLNDGYYMELSDIVNTF